MNLPPALSSEAVLKLVMCVRKAVGNNVIVGAAAMEIDNNHDNDIVARVPARSIKHKVRSKQLFSMAG